MSFSPIRVKSAHPSMHRVTIILFLLALSFCGLFFPKLLRAGPPTMTVVHTEWYPYTYHEQGRAKGFEIEIFQRIMGQMNVPLRFLSLPWQRCLQMMREGKAQAVISVLKTPERERYLRYPQEHISISKTQFFVLANRKIEYGGSLKNLEGFRIGVIAGFSYGSEFDNAPFLITEPSRDAEMLVKKVVAGRIDLAAENAAVVSAVAGRLGLKHRIRFLNPPIHMQKLYVGFSTDMDPEFIKRFSGMLKEYKMTEDYWKILAKHEIYY